MPKTSYLTCLIIFIFFLNNCSFQNTGSFFENRLEELEKEIQKKNSKLVFTEAKKFKEEISGSFEGQIEQGIINSNWNEKNFNSGNHIPHLIYEDNKGLIYKSKKLGKNKFSLKNSFFEPIIIDDNMFIYDSSGNIYYFSIEKEKLVWKYNFYKKRYKNLPILLKLNVSNNNLIISDNLGYLYSLSINSGDLTWAKNYGIPFKSNIKIQNENVFLLNQDNKFYNINQNDGETITSFETFPTLLNSEEETSISVDYEKNNLFFITSTGRLYSINYKTNNLNWLLDLSLTERGEKEALFFSSPIILFDDKLFLSNSVATYSIDTRNGRINWQLPFSTSIRPFVLKNFVALVSKNGFILNLDAKTGKVIWSKNLYKSQKKINEKKFGEITSLLFVSNKILVSTSKGFFLFIDHKNGEILNYARASRSGFFSKPVIVNKNIYIIDNKMKILIFD